MANHLASLTDSLQDMYLQDMDLGEQQGSEEQQNFGEQQLGYHTLQIEYPVLDLLPVDKPLTPCLRPPAHSGYREKPHPAKYHLPLSGTDFTIRLPTSDADLPPPYLDSEDVFVSLPNLAVVPGRSLLQIASYDDPVYGEMYRFRLLTERCGKLKVVSETELYRYEWEVIRDVSTMVWTKLIWRLLRRTSDRAYFHVHERLKNYSWYKKQIGEEEWNWKPEFDPKKFLAANLRVGVIARWNILYNRPVEESDFDVPEETTFILPCGHEQDMLPSHLSSMSVSACLRLNCDICGERVMGHDDGWRLWLLLHRERKRRERFSARELMWQQLTDEVPIETHHVSVHPHVLYKALEHAVLSIVPPESASPLLLQMTRSEGMTEALNIFQRKLEGDTMISCSWITIINHLMCNLDEAVGQAGNTRHQYENLEDLPAGWEALASLCFARATLLVGIPGYSGEDPMEVLDWGFEEEEDVSGEDDELDELAGLMSDARLE
jgi:hypothetical protein